MKGRTLERERRKQEKRSEGIRQVAPGRVPKGPFVKREPANSLGLLGREPAFRNLAGAREAA